MILSVVIILFYCLMRMCKVGSSCPFVGQSKEKVEPSSILPSKSKTPRTIMLSGSSFEGWAWSIVLQHFLL